MEYLKIKFFGYLVLETLLEDYKELLDKTNEYN